MNTILSIIGSAIVIAGLMALMYWSIRSAYRGFSGGCHGGSSGQCSHCESTAMYTKTTDTPVSVRRENSKRDVPPLSQ